MPPKSNRKRPREENPASEAGPAEKRQDTRQFYPPLTQREFFMLNPYVQKALNNINAGLNVTKTLLQQTNLNVNSQKAVIDQLIQLIAQANSRIEMLEKYKEEQALVILNLNNTIMAQGHVIDGLKESIKKETKATEKSTSEKLEEQNKKLEEQSKGVERLEKWAKKVGPDINTMGRSLNDMVPSVNSLMHFQQRVETKEAKEVKELEELIKNSETFPIPPTNPPTSTSPKPDEQSPLGTSSNLEKAII